jgi:hypothetical protein
MKGCETDVYVLFKKAPSFKSDKTKSTDRNLKQLAIEYDMTDIKSTREGEHQSGYMKRKNKLSDKQFAEATEAMQATQQQGPRPGDQVMWGGAGAINMKSVMGGKYQPVRDEAVGINPKAGGNLTGPRAGVIMNDHENLQVKTS